MSRLPPASAVLFDLDGTLVDSLRDIASACNFGLELLGLPPRPIPDYRHLVGEGVPALCKRAIGADHPEFVERLAELTRARYRVDPLVHTRPYAGMCELVDSLRTLGLPLGVLSNKPHELTVPVVREFWQDGVFDFVQGYDCEAHRKPSPHHVKRFCARIGVAADRVWLVGDTPTDLQTARAAGAACVCVTWGFRPVEELRAAGAEWLVRSPEELSVLVQSCRN